MEAIHQGAVMKICRKSLKSLSIDALKHCCYNSCLLKDFVIAFRHFKPFFKRLLFGLRHRYLPFYNKFCNSAVTNV